MSLPLGGGGLEVCSTRNDQSFITIIVIIILLAMSGGVLHEEWPALYDFECRPINEACCTVCGVQGKIQREDFMRLRRADLQVRLAVRACPRARC